MKTFIKIFVFTFIFLISITSILGKTLVVDINGSGQYTSIQAAFNAASVGDTVKILPGNYEAAISLSKNIVVLGSGYENTLITSSNNPTINMSAGKIMWLSISSFGGDGVLLNGGSLRNVVVKGCTSSGITTTSGSSSISNCVIKDNSNFGVESNTSNGALNVTNCIVYNNGDGDFHRWSFGDYLTVSYSCGKVNKDEVKGPGCIEGNPQFVSDTDLHIQLTSPCWDTGNTSINDPDGTRSDMGYFGGTECPIYPIVFQIKIVPQENGEIQIQAIGLSNY